MYVVTVRQVSTVGEAKTHQTVLGLDKRSEGRKTTKHVSDRPPLHAFA